MANNIGTEDFSPTRRSRYMVDYHPRRRPSDYAYGCVTDIARLIYRPMEPLSAFKDLEFSRSTMAARWKQGLSDVPIALQASPWLAPMPKELGVRVFDLMHDILAGRSEPV
jgi:Patatin phospholipase